MLSRREFLKLLGATVGLKVPDIATESERRNLGIYLGGEVVSKSALTYKVIYRYREGNVMTMVDRGFWEEPDGKKLFDKVWRVGGKKVRTHSQSDPRYGLYINSKGVLINTAERGCGLMSILMAESMANGGERINSRTIVKAMEEGWGDAQQTVVLSQPRLKRIVENVFPDLLPNKGEQPNASISLMSMWGSDYLLLKKTKEEEPDKEQRERFNHWVLLLDGGVVVDQLLPNPIQAIQARRSGNVLYKEIGARIDLRL